MCVATGYVRPNARRLGAVGQHKGLATLCLTFHVPNTVLLPTQLSGGRAKKKHSHAAILMKSSIFPLPGASSASHACVEASTAANVCASDDAARTNGKQLWPFLYTIRPHKAAHNAFRTRVPQETLIRPLPGAPRHSSKRLAESAC